MMYEDSEIVEDKPRHPKLAKLCHSISEFLKSLLLILIGIIIGAVGMVVLFLIIGY